MKGPACIAGCLLLVSAAAAQTPTSRPATPEAFEREVLENLRRQPVGVGTVADFNLPDEFLQRVAGRALRASYEQNFRIIVPDPPTASAPASAPPSAPAAPVPRKTLFGGGAAIILIVLAAAARRKTRHAP